MTREEIIQGLYKGDSKAIKEAIKVLEQEPCEDAVSRKAVLNTLDTMDKLLDEDRTVENYKALLKECYEVLTPVTPTHTETVTEFADRCRECGARYGRLLKQTKWIPVNERLPKDNGDYLVTGRQGAVNKRRFQDGRWYGNWAVLAWMPLPEPYKEE